VDITSTAFLFQEFLPTCFFYHGTILWNSLPSVVVEAAWQIAYYTFRVGAAAMRHEN